MIGSYFCCSCLVFDFLSSYKNLNFSSLFCVNYIILYYPSQSAGFVLMLALLLIVCECYSTSLSLVYRFVRMKKEK